MAAKAALLCVAALAGVDGWKAPRTPALLKPLATKLLEASLAVGACGALPCAAATKTPATATIPQKAPSRKYLFVTGFPFPLGPITERRTVQSELVKGRVYGFAQELRLSGITANSRCTVIRTATNELVVYDPVAPTQEFLEQLENLNAPVKHILLGATTYEHKTFVGPFSRKFPAAKVWAVPDQFAWPLDLAPKALGIDVKKNGGGDLIDSASPESTYPPDFRNEFEVKLLRPAERLGFGYAASEAALFHKPTKTLVLTDALINVPAIPTPDYEVANLRGVGEDGQQGNTLGSVILKLLCFTNFEAGRAIVDPYWARVDTTDALQRGWERNALLSLFFGPSPTSLVYPHASFAKLPRAWRVAPVVEALVYKSDRVRPELRRWVDDVAKWDFTYVSPAHFAAGRGSPADWKRAFGPVLAGTRDPAYGEKDLALLETLAAAVERAGII